MQMLGVTKIYIDPKAIKIRFTIQKLEIRDICTTFANQCADSTQNACIVTNS